MAFGGNNNKNKVFADINVTPLVDVMLVLLVIFMVTAPLMLNGIRLDLPKTKEVNKINLQAKQVILSFTKNEEFFIGKNLIKKEQLLFQINKEFKTTTSKVLFLRADHGLPYGKVASLMSFLKRGGITSIALVTELESNN